MGDCRKIAPRPRQEILGNSLRKRAVLTVTGLLLLARADGRLLSRRGRLRGPPYDLVFAVHVQGQIEWLFRERACLALEADLCSRVRFTRQHKSLQIQRDFWRIPTDGKHQSLWLESRLL